MDGAASLGKKAVIYMPKGSDPARLGNIRVLRREASITDLNYDDAVRLAWKMACENGWIMVQDTAWDGYEDIPAWIIQGYAALAVEVLAQWRAEELEPPTHLFLQAGVAPRPACPATWRRNLAMRSPRRSLWSRTPPTAFTVPPLPGMVSRIMSRAICPR